MYYIAVPCSQNVTNSVYPHLKEVCFFTRALCSQNSKVQRISKKQEESTMQNTTSWNGQSKEKLTWKEHMYLSIYVCVFRSVPSEMRAPTNKYKLEKKKAIEKKKITTGPHTHIQDESCDFTRNNTRRQRQRKTGWKNRGMRCKHVVEVRGI